MLDAKETQFKINDEGMISYQPNPTNPLPGTVLARAVKGDVLLAPGVELLDATLPEGVEPAAAQEKLRGWLRSHIATVLESLTALEDQEGLSDPVKGITSRLHEAMGIIPRADIEDMVAGLSEEDRAALRQRKVRMGPVLVFLPALNKPAAVRLRGLLWALWHDKSLPASVPADGITSLSLAGKDDGADPLFYRSVGYPVYGGRAIRVDMLDRLIGAIYDSADKGVFKARHDMAEWLGCPIADLYAVIEALGHQKINDPEEQKKAESTEEGAQPADTDGEAETQKTVETGSSSEAEGTASAPVEKPELATFRLKRGKAYGDAHGKRTGGKAPFNKKDDGAHKAAQKPRKKDKAKGKQPPRPKVYSTGPERKIEDSPFAMLQQLKVKSGEE